MSKKLNGLREAKTYQDRFYQVQELGYDSYSLYLASDYWKIIRNQVMRRDYFKCISGFKCRSQGKDRELQVHHVNYARSVMLGINLGCLITFCSRCHEYCEVSKTGAKYALVTSQCRTISLLTGCNMRPGTSTPRLGRWFRDRYKTSRFYCQNVLRIFCDQELPWYKQILNELASGKLPDNFIKYLDISPSNFLFKTKYKPMAGRSAWVKYLAEERKIKLESDAGIAQAAKRAAADLPAFAKQLQNRNKPRKKFWAD